jgi:NADH-quinone oxidoreductase subunit A
MGDGDAEVDFRWLRGAARAAYTHWIDCSDEQVMGMTGVLGQTQFNEWAVLGILFVIAAAFGVGNIVLSSLVGPRRKGAVKDTPYESGVDPVGDTKQRFNVRFYLVAMIFLVFDVEVLFLIPWLTIFPQKVFDGLGLTVSYGMLFGSVLVFSAIILVAYVYAWGKGVLKWD